MVVLGDTRVVRGTNAERRGRVPNALDGATLPPDTFVLGTTMPSLANTGPRYALDQWTGTTGTLTISTPGAVYEKIDFGTTRLNITAANVTIRDCKFLNTQEATVDTAMIYANSSSVSNLLIEFCEFNNAPTGGNVTARLTGVLGHDYTLRRCNIRNFTDGIGMYCTSNNIGGAINTVIEGNYVTDLSWWHNPTSGIVHPSDVKTHNDVIQHQGGYGLVLRGNYLRAVYSTTVGTLYTTGTTGDPRYDIVDGGGTYTSTHNGGSLSALMINKARGNIFNGVIEDNWIGGGAYSINAGDQLNPDSNPFGRVWRNRFYRDQRTVGFAIGVKTGVLADCGWTTAGGNNYATGSGGSDITTANVNTWIDDSTSVVRRNA